MQYVNRFLLVTHMEDVAMTFLALVWIGGLFLIDGQRYLNAYEQAFLLLWFPLVLAMGGRYIAPGSLLLFPWCKPVQERSVHETQTWRMRSL